ncbi:MAG: hypothetical protein MRY79_08000 [Alphaproteobacteria bacterium]|nr:hypothetical protein [Alphaproteobacteria bacterium]
MVGSTLKPEPMPVKWPKWIDSIPAKFKPLLVSAYEINDHSPEVNLDLVEWALPRVDHTSLKPTHSEGERITRRMVEEAGSPRPVLGICMNGFPRIVKLLSGQIKKYPDIRLAFTSNFPHGDLPAVEAADFIHNIANHIPQDVTNPRDIDSVIDYGLWLEILKSKGTARKAKLTEFCEKLLAEGDACQVHNFLWKVIQKANVHVMADKPYESLYLSSVVSMLCGADYVKTCTGMAAKSPYNDVVAADESRVENMIPMFAAIADFNQGRVLEEVAEMSEHAKELFQDIMEVAKELEIDLDLSKPAQRVRHPKISGGQRNEVDVARIRYLVKEMMGPEFLDSIIIGASDRLRLRLLEYIHENDPNCGFTLEDIRARKKRDDLPPHLSGLGPS